MVRRGAAAARRGAPSPRSFLDVSSAAVGHSWTTIVAVTLVGRGTAGIVAALVNRNPAAP
jgi:hypothetical protein